VSRFNIHQGNYSFKKFPQKYKYIEILVNKKKTRCSKSKNTVFLENVERK
jgi:hypothetical protein